MSPEFTDPQQWLKRISFYTGILEELAKQHDVISIERISYEGEYKQNGVKYLFINLRKRVVHFPFRMHNIINSINPDVVLVNGLIFPLQLIQLRLKLGKSIKIILLHRAEHPFSGYKKILQKIADNCVNTYLFTSSEFKEDWKENISQGKMYEIVQASSIFHRADRQKAIQALQITGSPVFLWIGGLIPIKDPLTVVKSFIQFLHHRSSAKLYMIYQSDELIQEVKELVGGIENIVLVGKVEHSNLQNWYNSADFFISGSHYEGSGIAVIEAMSCGCIPVLTNIISFRRMTGPGKCGLLYEAGNEEALVAALFKTGEMNIVKERDKALEQFNNELSFKAIGNKIERIVTSL